MNVTIDASIWTGAMDPFDRRKHVCNLVLESIFKNPEFIVFSPELMELELLACISRRFRDTVRTQDAVKLLRSIPQHNWVALDNPLIVKATHYATTLNLRASDAIYVATANLNNALLITLNEEVMNRASPVVEIISPHNWLWNLEHPKP